MLCITFGALAPVHVQHHARTIDVAHLQMQGLAQAQSAGVHRGEERVVVGATHTAQNPAYLLLAQHRRQARLALGAQDLEQMPVALKHLLRKKKRMPQ